MMCRVARCGWMVCFLALAGCSVEILPYDYPLARYTRRQLLTKNEPDEPFVMEDADMRGQVADLLAEHFPTPWTIEVASTDDERLVRGAKLYKEHCIHCHGLSGAGDGPTAPFLDPKPRDYRRGLFKWKSTAGVSKPTRDDLLRVIQEGALGTSMPPFKLMPKQDLDDLVDYVVYLSKRGEFERRLLQSYAIEEALPDEEAVREILGDLADSWNSAPESLVVPDQSVPRSEYGTVAFEQSLARGAALFASEDAGCYKCHGHDGRADPAQIAESELASLIDDWGNRTLPRDLTLGLFRGGRRPVDIYRRIHNGIAGTGMPAQGTNPKIRPQDIWDLVNLVRTLPYRPELLAPARAAESVHASAH